MSKHQCERCGTGIGFQGVCWRCTSKEKREGYEQLTSEQIQVKLQAVIARIDEIDKWQDISYDFMAILAYHQVDLSAVAETALKHNLYYPGELYRDAPEHVQDELIQRLLQPDCSSHDAGSIMLCLAAAGGEKVEQIFAKLEKEPLPWRSKLYVGPAIYAQQSGWGFNQKDQPIKLHYDKCFAFMPGGEGDPAAEAGKLLNEYCPDCGCQMIDILRLDGQDERFSFLDVNGKLAIPACPNCCSLMETQFLHYNREGKCTSLARESEIEENYVSEEELQALGQIKLSLTAESVPKYYARGGDEVITIGGLPEWIQDAQFDRCPDCSEWMTFLAAVPWSALFDNSEGTLYIEHCPECRTIGMCHQQT